MSLVKFDVTRNSPKWTVNSSGNLQSGSDNLPGFEFNPDGSYRGMLVEQKSRNLCLRSENINSTWTPSKATPTQSTETTPDGDTTNKYIKLVGAGGGEGHVRVSQNRSISVITKYTFSAFLKADQLAFARLQVYYGTSYFTQFYGLSGAGSLGTASAGVDDSTIEKYPNDWYRCTITTTPAAGSTTITVYVNVAKSISNVDVDRDGTSSIFVWGAQLEEGPIATSYIKTEGSTETRNEDVITLTSASQYLPNEGKVTFGWEQREDDTIYVGALSASVASGSRELVYEYSNTEQKLTIDGSVVQTITGTFDFSGMDRIELGHVNGADQPNTHLKYFAVE